MATQAHPDLILTRRHDGRARRLATCERLKSNDATRAIPVDLSHGADRHRCEGASLQGRRGRLHHQAVPDEELLARVGTHISLRREIEALASRSPTTSISSRNPRRAPFHRRDSPACGGCWNRIDAGGADRQHGLIEGETGRARSSWRADPRRQRPARARPLVKLTARRCRASWVESELFGHEKGAFTGAMQQRAVASSSRRRHAISRRGGRAAVDTQAKLLRVLQEREFERVGGSRSLQVDVRVIAPPTAIFRQVAAGRFRADLFSALNVFPIAVPPLRERRDDIRACCSILPQDRAKLGRALEGISPAFMERAKSYDWPGNIRELENVLSAHSDHVRRAAPRWKRCVRTGPGHGQAAPLVRATPAWKRWSASISGACWKTHVADRRRSRRRAHLGLNPSTLRGRLRSSASARALAVDPAVCGRRI